jgi:DNA-binding response OmpR family regulator
MSDEEPTREEHFRESCMNDEEPTREEHIRKIREKIGQDCIKTIKGVGYKFEE